MHGRGDAPTVAFDVIGTLLSLESPRARLVELGAPPHAMELWFALAGRDAMALSLAGDYRPFREILAASLPRALSAVGVPASGHAMDEVIRAFGRLDPVPGAAEALRVFEDSGWRILALTNGGEEGTWDLLRRGGLADRFSAVLSADRVRKVKPHPEVYGMARREASGELWLVAAHAFDVMGALRAGLRGAWVSEAEGNYQALYPSPDVVASSLPKAAEQVVAFAG